jgi:hypothetical protein
MPVPVKMAKARLVRVSGSGGPSDVELRFNPTQLTINKSAEYGGSNNRNTAAGGDEQFSRTGTRTLSFTALFDEWGTGMGGDAGKTVDGLQEWCNIDPSDQGDNPEPPTVMFVWGSLRFAGKVESINATFDLFAPTGTPLRGEVQVSMKERPERAEGQNPTSGGPAGRRSHVVIDGETLPVIVHSELGDAGLWRVVADMNGIDDPLDVPAGTSILLPSRHDATVARREGRAIAS